MAAISSTLVHRFKAYLDALRPKTLTASLVPVLVGTMIASSSIAKINFTLLFSVLSSALFIQIGTNLVNDALDFVKGADTEERLGPKRLIQKGLATPVGVMAAGLISFFLAVVCAIPIIITGGAVFAALIGISVLAGYLYTGGPYPIAYVGLGEVFVLIFFGPVLTGAAYYVQAGFISFEVILAGIQVGLLATVLIAINNLRDIDQDRKANKRTLAVQFGIFTGKFMITLFVLTPFLISLYWLKESFFLCLFPFFTLPMAFNLVRGIWRSQPSYYYNRYLQDSALLHLCFGALVAIGANVG